jgi:tyrosyl-tRNA synthetase
MDDHDLKFFRDTVDLGMFFSTLVKKGIIASFAEGRRAVAQGKVKIDGVKVVSLEALEFTPGVHQVQVGKTKTCEVTIPK